MMERYVIPLLIISVGMSVTALVSWLFRRRAKLDPFDEDV